jgi:hypothetical protein
VKIIACIEDVRVIEKILTHLGLQREGQGALPPARALPQEAWQFD